MHQNKKIAIVGLGYVGGPLAAAFAKYFEVIGYDISASKVAALKEHSTGELNYTTDLETIRDCELFIIAVPTPVDEHKVPDLKPLKAASTAIGSILKKGDIVVYESTVYPGCTEEVCVPILEQASGLTYKEDFKVGYSPERINPGDTTNTLEKIIKIVSACDEETLDIISKIYEQVITVGIHRTTSIKVAEAAKIIENTQRDVNIAFMNEIAIIFDKLDINTHEVLAAAGTKWNFLKFHPGLVGGHCIGIDPYYLTYKAKQVGYEPEVILSGRSVNNNIAPFIAQKIVKNLLQQNKKLSECRALVRGLTYKEDIADTRNSKVFDLISELKEYHLHVDVQDPLVAAETVSEINLITEPQTKYDVLVIAVAHKSLKLATLADYSPMLKAQAIVFDVKSLYAGDEVPKGITYLTL